MRMKKYVLLAIAGSILTATIAYGANPYDQVDEAFRRYEKAVERSQRISQIQVIGDIVCIIIFIAIVIAVWSKHKQKEKETKESPVKEIVHREVTKTTGTEAKLETCENCGRTIGKLEKSYVFEDHVVCCECHQRLKNQS